MLCFILVVILTQDAQACTIGNWPCVIVISVYEIELKTYVQPCSIIHMLTNSVFVLLFSLIPYSLCPVHFTQINQLRESTGTQARFHYDSAPYVFFEIHIIQD